MILAFKLLQEDTAASLLFKHFEQQTKSPWSMFRHPFSKAGLKVKRSVYIMNVVPSFPDFGPYGLVWACFVLLLGWPHSLLILTALFLIESLAFRPWIYFLVLWLGLRKFKSKAKIRMLSNRAALEAWVYGSD